MNSYQKLMAQQQMEYDAFPKSFAFSEEQLKEQLIKLGLNEDDFDKVTGIGHGGFIKVSDVDAYNTLIRKHNKEFQTAINNDLDGSGFIKDMFVTGLINHEYSYTLDIEETLNDLKISVDDLIDHPNIKKGLILAIDQLDPKSSELHYRYIESLMNNECQKSFNDEENVSI